MQGSDGESARIGRKMCKDNTEEVQTKDKLDRRVRMGWTKGPDWAFS